MESSVMVNRRINKKALLKKLGVHIAYAHIAAGGIGILLSIIDPRFSISQIVMYSTFVLGGVFYKRLFN